MNAVQWRTCEEPVKLIDHLGATASRRKLLLFGAACCRSIWPLLADPRSRKAVAVVERFADGRAGMDELQEAHRDARAAMGGAWEQAAVRAVVRAVRACFVEGIPARHLDVRAELLSAASRAAEAAKGSAVSIPAGDLRAQCGLFRDLFGDPFRPAAVSGAWLSWEGGLVVRLARAAYEERAPNSGALDNDRLAVLADALDEAGCADAEILKHLRGGGEHYRGCFAVDLLQGKE